MSPYALHYQGFDISDFHTMTTLHLSMCICTFNSVQGYRTSQCRLDVVQVEDKPVAISRGETLPWAQAARAASRTNGVASRISQAGTLSLIANSSAADPDELLLPEVVGVTGPPLTIFLNIILRRASTI